MAIKLLMFILVFSPTAFSQSEAVTEKQLEFQTHDGLTIRGKLSYPQQTRNGRVPGVLLLHGSGATDMNLWLPGSITADGRPHKLFKVLAHSLNEAGVVVYRYNKRGVLDRVSGAPTIDENIRKTGTVANLVKDARAALNVLRNDPSVDPSRIFLLGISEGTLLAPLLAQSEKQIAGLILMSSMGRNLRDTLYYQFVERHMNLARVTLDSNRDGYLTADEIAEYPEVRIPIPPGDQNSDQKLSMPELQALLLKQHYIVLDQMLRGTEGDWLKEHFALTPNYQTIATFQGPILLLQGEIDTQTPVEEAFLIADKLKSKGHTNFTLKTFPGLGHGFSPNIGKGGIRPSVGPIDAAVLRECKSWLRSVNEWFRF